MHSFFLIHQAKTFEAKQLIKLLIWQVFTTNGVFRNFLDSAKPYADTNEVCKSTYMYSLRLTFKIKVLKVYTRSLSKKVLIFDNKLVFQELLLR